MLSKKISTMRKVKMTLCKVCRSPYVKRSMTHKLCGNVECAIEWAQRERVRRERAEGRVLRNQIAERRDALKSLSAHAKDTEKHCNAYVRERDKDLPCISCGRHHRGQYHAGHYRSVGAMWSLRFDLANINKQCQPCNTEKHGNLLEYRINLIKKIGQAEVDRLEGPQPIKKYTVHELKNLAAYFRAKLKALKQSSKEAV